MPFSGFSGEGRADQIIKNSLVRFPSFMEDEDAAAMGLTHCPLCIGLALLCAVRFMAHALMAFQLRSLRSNPAFD